MTTLPNIIEENSDEKLYEKWGYVFQSQELLEQALTHKSYYNEIEVKSIGHNEKLEFLGDAVLDLSMGHLLYGKFPELDEGHLSKLRASFVNENFLMMMAQEMGLNDLIKLGKGEERSGGREKSRLLASVFEALIGAFYLDSGFEKSHQNIQKLFAKHLSEVDLDNHYSTDFKTRLQEKTQDEFKLTPDYKVIHEEGPDHEKIFKVNVEIQGKVLAEGKGRSKKQAEQNAAKIALESLT